MLLTIFSLNLIVFLQSNTFNCNAERALHRDKRYLLVFPRGGSYKTVIGFAMPIEIGRRQSLSIGWNFQFIYQVATNITQLETYPPILSKSIKTKRSYPISDRAIIYQALENILNDEGMNGKECLLESICENAFENLQHEVNGLYGQLIHIILTPDYGDGEIEPDLDSVYLEAQRAGEFGIECKSLYMGCTHENGLLGFFTSLQNEIIQ